MFLAAMVKKVQNNFTQAHTQLPEVLEEKLARSDREAGKLAKLH